MHPFPARRVFNFNSVHFNQVRPYKMACSESMEFGSFDVSTTTDQVHNFNISGFLRLFDNLQQNIGEIPNKLFLANKWQAKNSIKKYGNISVVFIQSQHFGTCLTIVQETDSD